MNSVTNNLRNTHRTLQLKIRADLQISNHVHDRRRYWVVGDPVSLKIFLFNDQEYSLMKWCDGESSLDDIKERFEREFARCQIQHKEIRSFLIDLHHKALLSSKSTEQGNGLYQRRKKKTSWMADAVSIYSTEGHPNRFLERMICFMMWFFSKPMTFVCIGMALSV